MASPLYGRGGPYTPKVGRMVTMRSGTRVPSVKAWCASVKDPSDPGQWFARSVVTAAPSRRVRQRVPAECTAVQRAKLAYVARRSTRSTTIDLPRTTAASWTRGVPCRGVHLTGAASPAGSTRRRPTSSARPSSGRQHRRRRARLPRRREDQHQRQRHPAALPGRAQQGRPQRRLLEQSVGRLNVHYSSGPLNHWFYSVSEGSGTR